MTTEDLDLQLQQAFFYSLDEYFTKKDALTIGKNYNIATSTVERHLLMWTKGNLVERVSRGHYKKKSIEFKRLKIKSAETYNIEYSKYISYKFNEISSYLFDNVRIIKKIKENCIIFKVDITVPLMDVLSISDELYGIKDCFLKGYKPEPFITGNGTVVYKDAILQCNWSEEMSKNAKEYFNSINKEQ